MQIYWEKPMAVKARLRPLEAYSSLEAYFTNLLLVGGLFERGELFQKWGSIKDLRYL